MTASGISAWINLVIQTLAIQRKNGGAQVLKLKKDATNVVVSEARRCSLCVLPCMTSLQIQLVSDGIHRLQDISDVFFQRDTQLLCALDDFFAIDLSGKGLVLHLSHDCVHLDFA